MEKKKRRPGTLISGRPGTAAPRHHRPDFVTEGSLEHAQVLARVLKPSLMYPTLEWVLYTRRLLSHYSKRAMGVWGLAVFVTGASLAVLVFVAAVLTKALKEERIDEELQQVVVEVSPAPPRKRQLAQSASPLRRPSPPVGHKAPTPRVVSSPKKTSTVVLKPKPASKSPPKSKLKPNSNPKPKPKSKSKPAVVNPEIRPLGKREKFASMAM